MKMKAMVGYSEDILNDFAVNIDSIKELKKVSKMKATGSFYKLMLGDKEDIIAYSSEIVTILLCLSVAAKYNKGKFFKKTFQEIVKKAVIPGLNRGLYGQESIRELIRVDSPDEKINILGAEAVSLDKPERAIALVMILVGKDLEELLLTGRDARKLLVGNGLLRKTFISIEDIKKCHV